MTGNRALFVFAAAMAGVAFILKALNAHYLAHDLNTDTYLGVIALLFLGFGLWLGSKHLNTHAPELEIAVTYPTLAAPVSSTAPAGELTTRETEILQLMALGHSNREIADRLFISLNTVKTHSSNLFVKLDVKRRTQAVLRARELGLIG